MDSLQLQKCKSTRESIRKLLHSVPTYFIFLCGHKTQYFDELTSNCQSASGADKLCYANDGFPGLTGYRFMNTIYVLTRKERKPFLINYAIWLKWNIWLVIVDQLVRFGFFPYFPSFVTLIEIPNERIFFLRTPTKHMTYSHMRYHRSATEAPAVPNGVAITIAVDRMGMLK